MIDLAGQARVTDKNHIFLTEDSQSLLNANGNRVLLFDNEGYISNNEDHILSSIKRIETESVTSSESGKCFLARTSQSTYCIL